MTINSLLKIKLNIFGATSQSFGKSLAHPLQGSCHTVYLTMGPGLIHNICPHLSVSLTRLLSDSSLQTLIFQTVFYLHLPSVIYRNYKHFKLHILLFTEPLNTFYAFKLHWCYAKKTFCVYILLWFRFN